MPAGPHPPPGTPAATVASDLPAHRRRVATQNLLASPATGDVEGAPAFDDRSKSSAHNMTHESLVEDRVDRLPVGAATVDSWRHAPLASFSVAYHAKRRSTSSDGPAMNRSTDIEMLATIVAVPWVLVLISLSYAGSLGRSHTRPHCATAE
jgi:hypothetical protein